MFWEILSALIRGFAFYAAAGKSLEARDAPIVSE